MKTLLILVLSSFTFAAQAQTITNITYKVTVDMIVTGVSTNSVNSTLKLDYATKADALKIDGLALAFQTYVNGGGTKTFEEWLKQDVKDRAKEYADSKQRVDNATLVAKLQTLLLYAPELLTANELSNLASIAAKAP